MSGFFGKVTWQGAVVGALAMMILAKVAR